MKRTLMTTRMAAVALLLVAALSSCGDDKSDSKGDHSGEGTPTSSTSEPTGTASGEATGGSDAPVATDGATAGDDSATDRATDGAIDRATDDTKGDAKLAANSPRTADVKQFCTLNMQGPPDTSMDLVKMVKKAREAAGPIIELGTPANMPETARAEWAEMIDMWQTLPENFTREDIMAVPSPTRSYEDETGPGSYGNYLAKNCLAVR